MENSVVFSFTSFLEYHVVVLGGKQCRFYFHFFSGVACRFPMTFDFSGVVSGLKRHVDIIDGKKLTTCRFSNDFWSVVLKK